MSARSVDDTPVYYQLAEGVTEEDYLQGRIILKEKEEYRGVLIGAPFNGSNYLENVLNYITAGSVERIFPNHKTPERKFNEMGLEKVDLSLIYQLDYSSNHSIEDCINFLLATGFFEYVEPLFLHKLLYSPNDPEYVNQWYIENVRAHDAWDISQGSSNVVIAITDTGIELTHDDLVNKIKYNTADPINGIDDDGDGYLDNYQGWDVGDDDNDPSYNNQHGLWVSGIAGMEVNNASHGSGIGFNSTILPVKIIDAGGTLAQAYPGIVYAADHGADIINCSWGSANSWSQYGEDIIAYATINQDALVVGAAGNSNAEEDFYPASFQYAISVCTLKSGNRRDNWATHSSKVDLASPGAGMQTTMGGNSWGDVGAGSSFAAPVVSGCAAIVKNYFPTYNAIQIGERLKVTSFFIDTVPDNVPYAGKLGAGKVDLYEALVGAASPSIKMTEQSYSSNTFTGGESIDFYGDFTNYLDPSSSGLTATLSSSSPYVSITQNLSTLGVINTLAMTDNSGTPFQFDILPGAGANTVADLEITYSDGTYSAVEVFQIVINRDYAELDVNDILVTVTSKGRFGYNQNNQTNGSGMVYQGGSPMFWEMNFMVAKSTSQVSFDRDNEFAKVENITIVEPGIESDKDFYGVFNDDPAGVNKMDLEIKQKTLGWNETGHENYFIVEYKLVNRGGVALDNIYPALFADWDIDVWNQNEATFDSERQMGIAYKPGGTYAGIRLLTDTSKVNYYAFNNDGTGGSYGIYDGYDQTEQYTSVSSGVLREDALLGDIAHIIGAGPYTLQAGDSVQIAFAIIAGNDLASIENASDSAVAQYYDIRHVELALEDISNASCDGDCDGSASVSASFGIPPYTYSWNDPLNQTGSEATGLCANQYIVTVTDAVGNRKSTNIIVSDPNILNVELDSTYNVNCFSQCNGTVDVSVSGGNSGYTYQWDQPGIPGVPNPMLCAGEYLLKVIDSKGCEDSVSVTIDEPSELLLTFIDTVNVYDPDSCNGEAIIAASGGTGVLSYLWDDPSAQTDSIATDLCAGIYTVEVTDENGCSDELSVTIDFIEGLEGLLELNQIALFPNPSNGLVTLENTSNESLNYEVYNMIGSKLESGIVNGTTTLDLSSLNSGMYFMILIKDQERLTLRFEVVK